MKLITPTELISTFADWLSIEYIVRLLRSVDVVASFAMFEPQPPKQIIMLFILKFLLRLYKDTWDMCPMYHMDVIISLNHL